MEHSNQSNQSSTHQFHPDSDPATIGNEKSNQKSQKPSAGLIIGMAICSILAIAGIGFGVYGMMESSHKSNEIDQLKVEINDKDQKIASFETDHLTFTDGDTEIDITDSANAELHPVISSTADYYFDPYYQSSNYYAGSLGNRHVDIRIRDGKISSCTVSSDSTMVNDNCTINGLSGDVYKIATVGEGQNNPEEVGFILTDGTVEYIKLGDLVTNGTADVVGTYNLDAPVMDIISTSVFPTNSPIGGYSTSIFVLSNGDTVPYGEISK